MKAKLSIIFLVINIIMNFSNGACAQSQNTDQQIITGLKSFYTSYINVFSSEAARGVRPANKAALIKKNCTISLINKINEDTRSGKLDYDPFLKAQDVNSQSLKTLTIKKGTAKPNQYIVSYIWPYTKEKTTVNLTMVKETNGWKIDSVW